MRVISNETTDGLTIHEKFCQNVTISYRQELAFYFKCRKN